MDNIFIDGSFIGCRSLTPFCSELGYNSSKGWIATGTIFSFLKDLLILLEEYGTEPRYAVVWDCKPTVRKEIDPNYKSNRRKDKKSEAYKQYAIMQRQMAELKALLPLTGFTQFECSGYEADDVLATLGDISDREGQEALLVVRDKDLYQCITSSVSLYDYKLTKDLKWFTKEYGITPKEWIDVQALAGDRVDNIPGISGVGIKTAIKLLRSYEDFEGVLASKVMIDSKMVKAIRRSRQLVELEKHLLLKYDPAQFDLRLLKRVLKRKGMKKTLSQSAVFSKVKGYEL